MTLALKDFEFLKQQFKDCVQFVFNREGKDKIADLPPLRRDQLQFLSSVFTEVESRIEKEKSQAATEKRTPALKPYINVLYGAMCVINQDITNHLSKGQGSRVRDRLNIAMGITKTETPDTAQYIDFYKSLNQFINLIYVGNDSRNKLNKEHALQTIPLEKLMKFANLSYFLEEQARKTATAKLANGGASTVNASTYRVEKLISAPLVAKFESFKDLKEALHQLNLVETAHKDKADISEIDDKNRAIQLQFLNKIAQSLDAKIWMNDVEKTAILAGSMYIVRGQIFREYGYEPLDNVDLVASYIRSGSVVHTNLTKILDAKNESVENIELLITAANQYINYMTVELKAVPKKEPIPTVRTNHIFSTIKDFSLSTLFDLAQYMIRSCRSIALDRCVTEMKKEIEAAKPKDTKSASMFGSWASWWTKPEPNVEDNEEDVPVDERGLITPTNL